MTTNWVPLPEERDFFCDVYIDESSQNHRYLVLGSLLVPYTHIDRFNEDIIAAREGSKIPLFESDGTYKIMKWQKVSDYALETYKKIVTAAFTFKKRHNLPARQEMGINCIVVDTSAKPLHKTGDGNRNIGYDKELYFLCTVAVANRYRDKLFLLYPDRRETDQSMKETLAIFNHGVHKWAGSRSNKHEYPFRRLKFADPELVLGLQVIDIFIGALAYRLNGHYDAPNANSAKKELCDYIWSMCKLTSPFENTSYAARRFVTWLHRPPLDDKPSKRVWQNDYD